MNHDKDVEDDKDDDLECMTRQRVDQAQLHPPPRQLSKKKEPMDDRIKKMSESQTKAGNQKKF